MRLMASPVCAIESTQVLALGRQERVALLELVELLDGHHVDGAEALDLRAQLGDGLLGRHRVARAGVGRRLDAAAAATPSPRGGHVDPPRRLGLVAVRRSSPSSSA